MRVRAAVLAGVFALLVSVLVSRHERGYPQKTVLTPPRQWLQRLPYGFVFGVFVGFFVYKVIPPRRPMMICPKCEATKYEDGVGECSCGGRYEKMEEMKHVR
jgi:cytosine/uracil/thiamine/allantoin permease